MTTAATEDHLCDVDRRFFERELASFLPDRIFDAHCHLWSADHYRPPTGNLPENVGSREYFELIDNLHPGRSARALFIPMPSRPDAMHLANAWIARETAVAPDNCRGLYFVKPGDDPEQVRDEVRRLGLCGLKCYHTMAAVTPTWEADISAFLPEPLVRVAHEEEWVITLHLVKSRSIADRANIDCVRRYCRAYPGMKLILAHSARGFQPAHNLEGLPHLAGLDNLWFDTSVNCEPMAHVAIMKILGHERLMYGSDLPVSHFRGRSLASADSFLWLYEETPVWGEKHARIEPVLIGLEHLRSLKWACWSVGLSDSAVEDLFYNNAARLFGG